MVPISGTCHTDLPPSSSCSDHLSGEEVPGCSSWVEFGDPSTRSFQQKQQFFETGEYVPVPECDSRADSMAVSTLQFSEPPAAVCDDRPGEASSLPPKGLSPERSRPNKAVL